MTAIRRYGGSDRKPLQHTLRDAGFRSTEGRLALLSALKKETKPLSVEAIARRVRRNLDEANVYRALEAFARAGIVSRVDLQHEHTHYEWKAAGHAHHHLVCLGCDRVEDFAACEYDELAKKALKQVPSFAKVIDHSFELFGLCASCVGKHI